MGLKLILNIELCQGEHINIFIPNIGGDQNTTYVFASKGTHVAYFNLNLQ